MATPRPQQHQKRFLKFWNGYQDMKTYKRNNFIRGTNSEKNVSRFHLNFLIENWTANILPQSYIWYQFGGNFYKHSNSRHSYCPCPWSITWYWHWHQPYHCHFCKAAVATPTFSRWFVGFLANLFSTTVNHGHKLLITLA